MKKYSRITLINFVSLVCLREQFQLLERTSDLTNFGMLTSSGKKLRNSFRKLLHYTTEFLVCRHKTIANIGRSE